MIFGACAAGQKAALPIAPVSSILGTANTPSSLSRLRDPLRGMIYVRRSVLAFTFIIAAFISGSPAFAEATNASPEEIDWFVGKWTVGPADVPGFETIAGDTGSCEDAVEIIKSSDTTIRRRSKTRSGEAVEFEFEVKKFGENYPWWPSDGPGPVARITGDDVFILASTTKGMADWDRGLQHTRCPE